MEKQYRNPMFEVVLLRGSHIITASGPMTDPDTMPDVDFQPLVTQVDENNP